MVPLWLLIEGYLPGMTWLFFYCIFQLFAGNRDSETVVHNKLRPPIKTRFIRLLPTQWNKQISMRIEIYGCPGIRLNWLSETCWRAGSLHYKLVLLTIFQDSLSACTEVQLWLWRLVWKTVKNDDDVNHFDCFQWIISIASVQFLIDGRRFYVSIWRGVMGC